MDSNKLKLRLDDISEVNPALTCYHRDDPAPVLPLRDEPDLLSWLENTGRLVSEKDGDSQEISTIEEEELSALMGEKEEYKNEIDQIKKYFKFPLSNKVFRVHHYVLSYI